MKAYNLMITNIVTFYKMMADKRFNIIKQVYFFQIPKSFHLRKTNCTNANGMKKL